MRKTILSILPFLLLLVMRHDLLSQQVSRFSDDPLTFAGEVGQYFSSVTSPAAGMKVREALDPFLETWSTPAYGDRERALVIGGANAMLDRRLSSYPDFYHYIITVHQLKVKGNKGAIDIWMQELQPLLINGSMKSIREYLEHYAMLTRDGILFRSSSFQWYVTDTMLRVEFDTAVALAYRNTDLVCASAWDTSRIYRTDGRFYPVKQAWSGHKGHVTWEKVGLDEDSVYADLQNYFIDMKGSDYQADSVRFINKTYFRDPLFGQLTDRVLSSKPGPGSSYPQFASYLINYEIRNLFKNIDFTGGFSVVGARVIGSGGVDANAYLTIYQDDKVRAVIRSGAFQIERDRISANPASLSIYNEEDSIYHPGMQMKYFDDKRQIVLFTTGSGISNSPFFNGYHKLDMYSGAMYWYLGRDIIEFQSVPGINPVSVNEFASGQFFSKYDFYKIQGIDETNPLYIIRDYSRKYGTSEITPNALAQFMDKSPDQVKAMLVRLSMQGFLFYDLVNDKAVIQDRLDQYLQANAGIRDHDVIKINSEIKDTSNATLNLENFNLLIRGVKEVFLSDSQQVYIYPGEREILVKKGLDFTFSGRVEAGLFDFYSKDCSFEYDSFKLNLPHIDSLSFQVRSFQKNERGERPLRKVANVIEIMGGSLLIDFPSNKSGLGHYPQYPVFISEQESFVYYDHDTLYDREKFAYHIHPFTLDSLDNFKTDNLQFDGYLVSAGIFPDIHQPLKVQPDYSLGFVTRTPKQGYPVYSAKGKYFEEIRLSNQGLHGRGMVDYLTSITLSDDFLFYPDTMITTLAKEFKISPQMAGVEYPHVEADSVAQKWFPYQDTMHVRTIRHPFRMYSNQALLYGDLYYTPWGLSGRGNATFETVELASESFRFMQHTVDADSLDFRLLTQGTKDLAVSAEKYRSHIDLETRTVQFKTNRKGSMVSFPYNNFECYMDNVDWNMDRGEMLFYNDLGEKYRGIDEMNREELLGLDLSGSYLMATNPEMDSLSFFSMTARYDLNNYILDAEDVKLIRIADAAIFPDSGNVTILKGGRIETLKNAAIIADTANRYHLIEEAEVNVRSKNDFTGNGIYQFTGENGNLQEFKLSGISVDSAGHTIAEGTIPADPEFRINPYFVFKGDVSLVSARKELRFEGGFQTPEDCFEGLDREWVYFNSWIDPFNVRIPLQDSLVSLDGAKLDLGIFISDYQDEIYACWFRPRILSWDAEIASARGYLSFDTLEASYLVNPVTAIGQSPGNSLRLSTRRCILEAQGRIGLGLNLNYVDQANYGRIQYLTIPDSAVLNLTMTFDFLFYEPALNMISDSLLKANLRGVDITGKSYQDFLNLTMDRASADQMKSDISLYGNIRKVPENLVHTLVLTDIQLFWNSETNSFISRGPIGVLGAGRNVVNRYVRGNLEIIRRRAGDAISIYLEMNPKQWYFFDYRNGIMQTLSSDMTYNSRIESLKPEKRMTGKQGIEEGYEFVISSRRKLVDFLRRMEQFAN